MPILPVLALSLAVSSDYLKMFIRVHSEVQNVGGVKMTFEKSIKESFLRNRIQAVILAVRKRIFPPYLKKAPFLYVLRALS